jgi:4-carboxymuconolactone decarboxylase
MYVPEIFKQFIQQYPEISDAYKKIGVLSSKTGPMDEKTQHLLQLGVAIGAESKGAVRSHARRALELGAAPAEVMQAVLLSGTIVGFPSMMAAYGWVREVLAAKE